MTTGANLKISNGRMLWYKPLISGDELLIQSHETRMSARQGTYRPFLEYGNPFVDILSGEIGETRKDMRIVSDTKQCALQDGRIIDCIVDTDSIEVREGALYFEYELFKKDGGTLKSPFPSEIEDEEVLFDNFISEDGENFITENSENFVTESL